MRNEPVRLQPYVDAPLAKQLAAYSAATGKTTSFVVQAALRQYLDRTDDKMLLVQRLNKLGRAWNRTQRDLELFMEGFAIYVKLWFAHTPQISARAKDSARREAESRFAEFQEYLVEQFQGGRRFVDDLPREVIADEAQLSKMPARRPRLPRVARLLRGPAMKSSRLAGKRGSSKAFASSSHLDGSALPVKEPTPPAPAASVASRTAKPGDALSLA